MLLQNNIPVSRQRVRRTHLTVSTCDTVASWWISAEITVDAIRKRRIIKKKLKQTKLLRAQLINESGGM